MRTFHVAGCFALLTLFAGTPAHAADLFSVDVKGGPTAGGDSVASLIADLLDRDGEFSELAGGDGYYASVDWLGVDDALSISARNGGQSVTVTIPSTGFSKTFTGDDPNAVAAEVEAWLRNEGAATLGSFLDSVNAASPLGLLDGNPRATTALLANGTFERYGLAGPDRALPARRVGATLSLDRSLIRAGGFSDLASTGTSVTVHGRPGKRVGLAFTALGQVRSYSGARLHDVGAELALPVAVLPASEGARVSWTLTPVVQTGLGLSTDTASGGVVVGGGLSSSVGVRLPSVELTLGQQITGYKGVPIQGVQGFDLHTNMKQVILRHGVRVGYSPLPTVTLEGGMGLGHFAMGRAAVPHHATFTAGASLTATQRLRARLVYEGEAGRDWRAHGGRIVFDLGLR